jgi:hypothetical protein
VIWSLWGPVGLKAARSCRRCGEPIPQRDAFGMSEGVCGPCRLEGERSSIYLLRPTGSEALRDAA